MIKWTGRLLQIGFWSAAAMLFLLLILVPAVIGVLRDYDLWLPGKDILHGISYLQTVAMRTFFCAWFFFLGGCFASFLNVIAWRIPRGKTILGSSSCPICGSELDLSSNMPVFGWFRNEADPLSYARSEGRNRARNY